MADASTPPGAPASRPRAPASVSSATRSAPSRFPPTPTTASRRRGPSPTSPSAAAARTRRSSGRPCRSRRPPPARTTPRAACPTTSTRAIVRAADELLLLTPERDTPAARELSARLIDAFRVDPFQAGAGVSHNMNTNEVLANRAIEILHDWGLGSGQAGRLLGRQPERPRQHGAVHERRLPHVDARRDPRPPARVPARARRADRGPRREGAASSTAC